MTPRLRFSVALAAALFGTLSTPLLAADAAPAGVVEAATADWGTDYAAALKRAAAEKKPVLLDFTGSDWCIWCKRLHDEVLSQRPFLDFAQDRLILVEVDFPQHKEQSGALKKQNESLQEKYQVDVYPTIILVDADGRELGRTGYMEGGPKTFVRELKRITAGEKEP